jgi:protoporphyrinogen oxidase
MTLKKAIIIGAGPAGLTAAYELLKRTDIVPIILEKSGDIGGISKTINYKGNRIDIGGHRFFSKSDRVMNWWLDMMPIQDGVDSSIQISYQNKTREIDARSGEPSGQSEKDPDKVMLVRKRLSRIYFLRKFFTYPIQLSLDTLSKLGIWTTVAIMFSYLKAQLLPRKPEKNLEDFMVNRFGQVLYKLFFRDYTEKVWGIPCHKISAEWGAQRIKGVSISKAIQHAVQSAMKKKQKTVSNDISQKDTETSLIEQFLYPKYGPGQLWEEVARQVEKMGGKILMHHDVKRVYTADTGDAITAIAAINNITGETSYLEGDYFFSTMPVQELIGGLDGPIPGDVQEVAAGLQYRDFITVGLLLKQLSFQDKKTGEWKPLSLEDTWIYIQEKDVTVGRLQVFNNWSPYMVKDPATTWIGMEFFCNQQEPFWNKPDEEIKQLAIQELEKIGLASAANVLDSTVIRVEKTYPAYFGTYEQFDVIRAYIDRFENLFLVGRNGMHKYNNSDHSMLTAMVAVDNIAAGVKEKENVWSINTEQAYHEEKHSEDGPKENKADKTPAAAAVGDGISFKSFLLKKPQLIYLFIAGVALLLQLVVFKSLYPFAGFINGDSYVYIESAYWNMNINTYPVGYSKFLRAFSVFSTSDTVLVTFQYLLIQFSTLYFIFTLSYFYKPGKVVFNILFIFMVCNPVFLYLANYISSDALFLAISLLWFTQLLWILHRPTPKRIFLQALILLFAFSIRYNALFYPGLAAFALVLSRQKAWIKAGGIAMSILVIFGFIILTSNKYQKLTGQRQFSPFSGWQMANNALYAYRYVPKKEKHALPDKFKVLDAMVTTYFDTSRSDFQKNPQEMLEANTWYMWDPNSPLQRYMNLQFKKDSMALPLKRWATVAPLYAEYGTYLMKQYPRYFLTHYIWPNAMKYYTPPVEFLDTYNTGKDSVAWLAQMWFDYKSLKVRTAFKDMKVTILDFYPTLTGILNFLFLIGFLGFAVLNGFRLFPRLAAAILLAGGLWFANFGFSVFASPVALRFQLFPLLVALSFALISIESIWKTAFSEK